MNICVLGVGYIGLPTAAILSKSGHRVFGLDTNEDHIDSLNNHTFNSTETGLMELIEDGMNNGYLTFHKRIQKADVYIICTPTPTNEYGEADLSFLISALDITLKMIEEGNLIIIESTIPPNTINKEIKPRIEAFKLKIGKDIFLAYCPERVIPNNLIYELIHNPRIIGGYTLKCGMKAYEVYSSFVKGDIHIDSIPVVEMVKLVENSYRYVNLAFVNELALMCEAFQIDPYRVINLANKHPRVHLLNPGIGVGGHCLPVDSKFLINANKEYSKLIQISSLINEELPELVSKHILSFVQSIDKPKIAIWGISYKENSKDIRNSPALKICELLKEQQIEISVYDPVVYNHDMVHCIKTIIDADLLVILVKHDEFIHFDYDSIAKFMNKPTIFDTCNAIGDANNYSNTEIFKLYR